jgi:hypothetical protein
MPIKTLIQGGDGNNTIADVVNGKQDYPRGLVTFTESLRNIIPGKTILLNSTLGALMNINGANADGTSLNIYNGDQTYWIPTTITGTDWNFDIAGGVTGNCIDQQNAKNGDQMLLSANTDICMNEFSSLEGAIELVRYNINNNDIFIHMAYNGATIGNTINVEDYIDTGILNTYQNFQIPKEDFGISAQIINEIYITFDKIGGNRGKFKFDNFQMGVVSDISGSRIYTADPRPDYIFRVNKFALNFINSGVTLPDYDQLFDISSLNIGIVFRWKRNDIIQFSAIIKNLTDLIDNGFTMDQQIIGTTNTITRFSYDFCNSPLMLDPRKNDNITVTINDDLTSLLHLRCYLQGTEENINEILH